MKTVKDFDIEDKRVVMRCDFNVPLGNKGILDDFRVRKTLPTIQYLSEHKAKVILISHLGRPEGREMKFSLKPVAERLEELLGRQIEFLNDCIGDEIDRKIADMKPGEIVLLENLRFYKEEKEADPSFIKKLAELGDIFIQDAFGVSHRAHASVTGVPEHLPSGIGFLVEEELKILSKVIDNPERPLAAIIGGAKINTKVKLIERFLRDVDNLLLGGKTANIVLDAKGISVGRSAPAPDIAQLVENLDFTSPKLHLPVDVIAVNDSARQAFCGDIKEEELVLDIGPETIDDFSKIISQAKTIIWNGPLGKFEDEEYSQGTRKIIEAILASPAFSVVGGGETAELVNRLGLADKFGYVSTGGGAMLKFLSGEKLPGIEAIEN
ncbi:phosphoglycerate kinase [Candidatus Parcubacteria bacterium]|nr:phosphoglycerate kinase [Candidatus Parcubacteria bacterium]